MKQVRPPPGSPVGSEDADSPVEAQDPFQQDTLSQDPQIAEQSLAFADFQFFDDGLGSPNHDGVDSMPFKEEGLPSDSPRPGILDECFDEENIPQFEEPVSLTFPSGHTPRLEDLLLPGTDISGLPPDFMNAWPQDIDTSQAEDVPMADPLSANDDVEEIIRQHNLVEFWPLGYPSPSPSASSSSSGGSWCRSLSNINSDNSEVLFQRFDEQTCGILSVKDGMNENPWRTILWPMALQEPTLYHAIISMTACHGIKQDPSLRITGIRHQELSVEILRHGLEQRTMPTDVALATTIVLGFCESWLSETNTGIMHLRGARKLIQQGLAERLETTPEPADSIKLQFLRNTLVYMDVIARLTAIRDEDPDDLDSSLIPMCNIELQEQEIDPLMGCAATLFPVMGEVLNLVRQVRKTQKNSPIVVSRAAELKSQLRSWTPPEFFIPPEDGSVEVEHLKNTAEAYRLVTLLLLYQAVPMICSKKPTFLAEEALFELACVPTSSRAIIIHIFPLFIAGCEAVSEDNRKFVRGRWTDMIDRMHLGSLDRCWDVTKEVWDRRDKAARPCIASVSPTQASISPTEATAHLVAKTEDVQDVSEPSSDNKRQSYSNPTYLPPMFPKPEEPRRNSMDLTRKIDHDFTVKGRLHWGTIMKEWDWESGCCSFLIRNDIG